MADAAVEATSRPAATPPLEDRAPLARLATFEDVLALIRERRDMQLLLEVEAGLRLVHYAPGRIEFEPAPAAAPDLASRLAQRLQAWTGARWGVSVVGAGGAPTLAERRDAERETLAEQVTAHPLVRAVLAAFPEAEIRTIGTPAALPAAAEDAGEDDAFIEDWDPDDPFGDEI
jgi:DNA polymerase-3 subunit gamma/tau